MTINLSTFRIQVKNLIPDIPAEEVTDININQQIRAGVNAYSVDLPEVLTQDVTGDGGRYYAISSLTGWKDEFSQINRIEYPAATVASDETPVYLEDADWDESYYDGSTRYLYLPNHAPAATESLRITYTGLYSWAASSTTVSVARTAHGFVVDDYVYQTETGKWTKDQSGLIGSHIVTAVADADNFTAAELTSDVPPAHFFAICYKIACLVCREIAARYSRTSDSTIAADSVNHPTRAQQFSSRAGELCGMYGEMLNLGDGEGNEIQQGYADFIDWDSTPGWPGNRRFVFHGEDWR